MPAPKGNQFWKNRTKHGRDALFNDPEKLWESACEYFEFNDGNPIQTIEFNGKDATECIVPKMRAYSKCGLCVYLDCSIPTFEKCSENKDFFEVYTRICNIIYNQKFEGAAAGVLNANIIARDLGLMDNSNVAVTGSLSFDDLSKLVSKIEA